MEYTKKEWNSKDEISHDRLNDIENALEECSKQTDENTDLINSLALTNDMIPQGAYDLDDPPDYPIFRANSSSTNLPTTNPNQYMVFYFKSTNSNYQAMFAFSWNNRVYTRSKFNSATWADWVAIN